jgi:hypothetical protein
MVKQCEVTAFAKKHTQGKREVLHILNLDWRTRRAEAERNRERKLLMSQNAGWRVSWCRMHAGD